MENPTGREAALSTQEPDEPQIRPNVCHCLELERLALVQIWPPQLQAVLGLLVALTACGCERASSCGAFVDNREQWHTFTGASTMKVALSN